MNAAVEKYCMNKGAALLKSVDISRLSPERKRGFDQAVVFIMALSREFVMAVKRGLPPEHDEFMAKEHKADARAGLYQAGNGLPGAGVTLLLMS